MAEDWNRDLQEREESFADSTPKRENPYKKKKKQPSTPAIATAIEDTPPQEGIPTKPKKSLKDRWDDFIFAHVKLMVFIIGVTVVMMLLGPFSVFRIAEWVEEAQIKAEMAERDKLTITYVQGLCDKAEPITWQDFQRFYIEDRSSDVYVTWIIPVEEGYEVWMGGGSTTKMPDYVTMYSNKTGKKVDLTKGLSNLESYLAENN